MINFQLSIFNCQFLQQSFASIFQYLNHIFKALVTSVIRVWYMVDNVCLTIVCHAYNLRFSLYSRSQSVQLVPVAVIHTHD